MQGPRRRISLERLNTESGFRYEISARQDTATEKNQQQLGRRRNRSVPLHIHEHLVVVGPDRLNAAMLRPSSTTLASK